MFLVPGSNARDFCVTSPLQRSKPSAVSEENQTPSEGVNDSLSRKLSTVCACWVSALTLEDNPQQRGFLMRWQCVCVCVFLGVNVLTRLSDLINTCTATAPLVFMLKLFSDTHVHTHTHNSEQCVVQLLMSGPLGTAPDSLPPCQLPAHDPLIHPPPHGPHSWCRAYTM